MYVCQRKNISNEVKSSLETNSTVQKNTHSVGIKNVSVRPRSTSNFDESSLESNFFNFVGKLYSNYSITGVVVKEIVNDVTEYTENMSNLFAERLKSKIPEKYHRHINESLQLQAFEKSSTDYPRLQFFKNAGYLISPRPFKIGEIKDNKKIAHRAGSTTAYTTK